MNVHMTVDLVGAFSAAISERRQRRDLRGFHHCQEAVKKKDDKRHQR